MATVPAVATLDYPKAKLQIGISTPIEYAYRAKPVAKEPWTAAFIEGMTRGDVLWDIGANVGSYALIAASRGNDVVAIEPGRANFQALLANMQRNQLKGKILALNVALGAMTQVIHFGQQTMPGYGETGYGSQSGDKSITLDVQQVALDELVFGVTTDNVAHSLPAPTHLKIDVDGHELGVLAGAQCVLTASPCKAVLIEVATKLGERVTDLLTLWGWTRTAVYDTRDGQRIVGVRTEEFRKA